MKFQKQFRLSILIFCLTISIGTGLGQTTAFNFQGRLNDGTSPANGRYDLQFKLFDAITGGTQFGTTVDRPNLALINGVFSTTLDFGASAFASGNLFLEISVRPFNSPNAYVVLGARQQILSVPLAVRATSAANADNATNAQNAVNATNSQNAVNSTNAVSAQNSVNATNSQNSVNATNAVAAQNSLALGGFPAAEYPRLNISNPGGLAINGNIRQAPQSFGVLKGMVNWGHNTCYNSMTDSNVYPCGFTFPDSPINGVYIIDFGFPVRNRPISVSAEYNGACLQNQPYNRGVNYRFRADNPNLIEVFTFAAGNSNDTFCSYFMLLVF